MRTVKIADKGCRDCGICEEVCPTKVFGRSAGKLAVAREKDCIGCVSCVALCPSRCVDVAGGVAPLPLHRVEQDARIVERMLRQRPLAAAATTADLDSALTDVRTRLFALGESVTETMGRGVKAVGRKAGTLSAAHLPDLYDGVGLHDVLLRLSARFAGSFHFESAVDDDSRTVTMRFPRCAVAEAVRHGGQSVGSAVLCTLFHEYWAGLLGAYTGRSYQVELLEAAESCRVRFAARGQ